MDSTQESMRKFAVDRHADDIAEAKRELDNSSDGPITAFVLISRATRYAAVHPEKESAAANALSELLEDYGLLSGQNQTLRETGS